MSQPPSESPDAEEIAKKSDKKNDEKNLRSFTIRVEEAVIKKLESVGKRTGDDKIARIARNYLRLADVFAVDNNRIEGHDGKELALVPVEILRYLIRRTVSNDEYAQIDLGNEFGKYLKDLFYLDPRNTVAEKVDFIQRLGWFTAKRDPTTKQVLIPTEFAPELFIQAMVHQIMLKRDIPPLPKKVGKDTDKDLNKKRSDWAESLKKDRMAITKNVETEIGFDAFSYE